MKTSILVLLFVIFSVVLCAQTPNWLWAQRSRSTYRTEEALSVVTDTSGNIYIAGRLYGPSNFDLIAIPGNGSWDSFVAKYNTNGALQWVVTASDVLLDNAQSITIDNEGYLLLTGIFEGTCSFGDINLVTNGQTDLYVAKLSPDGDWIWAINAGGQGEDASTCITADANGNAYVSGSFVDVAQFGGVALLSAGSKDMFIAKLDSEGQWLWAKCGGSTGIDVCTYLDYSDSGFVVASCQFAGSFPLGGTLLNGSGSHNIGVFRMDLDGNIAWAASGWATDNVYANGVAADDQGNVYLTGDSYGQLTIGNCSMQSAGWTDAYVAKFNPSGTCDWLKSWGANADDIGRAVIVGSDGSVYCSGSVVGTVNIGGTNVSGNSWTMYVVKLDSAGNYQFVLGPGGVCDDIGESLCLDNFGNLYMAGYFQGTCVFGNIELDWAGEAFDTFLAKLRLPEPSEVCEQSPPVTQLSNYPNPFSGITTISIKQDTAHQAATVEVYNARGQLVRTLLSGALAAGETEINWDGKDNRGKPSAQGVYFYRLSYTDSIVTGKMLLLH